MSWEVIYSPDAVNLLEDLSWIVKAWGTEQTECPLLKLLSGFPFCCMTPRLSSTLLPVFVENSGLFTVGNASVKLQWNSALYGFSYFWISVCSLTAVLWRCWWSLVLEQMNFWPLVWNEPWLTNIRVKLSTREKYWLSSLLTVQFTCCFMARLDIFMASCFLFFVGKHMTWL